MLMRDTGPLESYLIEINRIPLLTQGDEIALAKQLDTCRKRLYRGILATGHGMQAIAILKTERDWFETEKRRVRADELRYQASEQELAAQKEEISRLSGAVLPDRHLEPRVAAAARLAQEQKIRIEVDARVKKRQPYLQELASLTANFFGSAVAQSTVRSEVLNLITQSKVAAVKEDDAFVDGDLALAESFYLDKTKYPYMTYGKKPLINGGKSISRPWPRLQASSPWRIVTVGKKRASKKKKGENHVP
jgi:hypothetical protein